MNIGRPEEDRVTQSDYAGRATANSPEWPEVFTIKGVAKVKHPASGQPYRVSRQSVDWKQPWDLRASYSHGVHDKFAQFKSKTISANWKENKSSQNCSLYGSGRPEYHQTRMDLMRNDPESVFADPNTPKLKQLLKERDMRRKKEIEALKRPSSSKASTRPSTAGSVRDSKPSTTLKSRPSTSEGSRPTSAFISPCNEVTQVWNGQVELNKSFGVYQESHREPVKSTMSAWQEAIKAVRTNVDVTSRTGTELVSISVKGKEADSWVSPHPCALAVTEANLQAISLQQGMGHTKKMSVPLSGASVTKNSAALKKARAQNKRVSDARMVRDLI